ncbi:MAG: tyrosine-type recombinase/integrase [Xanthomonadales bacterium]|nr:tyrosine-type recombinase/integrase [Xanthomonadales bacterium]
MATNLTDTAVRRLKATGQQYERADKGAPGLVVRVTAKGSKTWLYRYRDQDDGKMRRYAIGPVEDAEGNVIGVDDARVEVRRLKELRKTTDPHEHRVEQERLERLRTQQGALRRRTFKEVAEDLIERFGDGKHGKGWLRTEGRRALERNVYPYLGDWPVDEITRRDVIAALEKLRERGKLRGKGKPTRLLNNSLMLIRRVLQHAVDELTLIDANVAWRIPKRAAEKSRDRNLTLSEIQQVFTKLPETGMAPVTVWALRFQLLTASRMGEVAALPWSEIDLGAGLWRLPAKRSKNGKPGDIPLSAQAVEVLQQVRGFYGASTWCFPSTQASTGHLHRDAASTGLARLFNHDRRPLGEIEKFVPHDLRRTASTLMGDMGILQEVIDACLRNSRGGVSAVYNRSAMLPHTRKAMAALGQAVEDAMGGQSSNVVNMEAAR